MAIMSAADESPMLEEPEVDEPKILYDEASHQDIDEVFAREDQSEYADLITPFQTM